VETQVVHSWRAAAGLLVMPAVAWFGARAESFGQTSEASIAPSIQVNDDGYAQCHHDLYTSGQRAIAVAGTNVMLSWSDKRFGDSDVFFARSADLGDQWSENVRVNDTASGDGTNQRNPSFVVAPDSTVHAIWSDSRLGVPRIFGARSFDGGASFSANYPIEPSGSSDVAQEFPSLAADVGGVLYAAWKETHVEEAEQRFAGRIRFAHSADGGVSWSDPVLVDPNAPSGSAQQNPTLVADASAVYVAWMDTRRGDLDIFFSRSLDRGATWEPSVLVTSSFSAGSWEMHPSLGVDSAGKLYLAFTQGNVYDIHLARSSDGGRSWTTTRVDGSSGRYVANLNPALAVNPDGRVAVVWADSRRSRRAARPQFQLPSWLKFEDNYDIFCGTSVDGGASFSVFRVSDSTRKDFEFFPTVALDDQGTAFVAWQGLSQGNNNIFFARPF
jgi:BNR repeat-like domain